MNERNPEATQTPLPGVQQHSYTARDPGQPEPMKGAEVQQPERRGGRPRESLDRADRYIVGLLATLLGSTLIGFVTIGGQLLNMQQQFGGLHTEVEGIRTEMHEEIGSLRAEMNEEIGQLRAEMHDQFGELSERVARIETVLQIHHGPLPGP